MEINSPALAVEASAYPRQEKSSNNSEVDSRPELFDFANILGGLVSAPPALPSNIPVMLDETASASAMLKPATDGGAEDTSASLDLSNIAQSGLQSPGSSARKSLGHSLLSAQPPAATMSGRPGSAINTGVARQLQSDQEPQPIDSAVNVQLGVGFIKSASTDNTPIVGNIATQDGVQRTAPHSQQSLTQAGSDGIAPPRRNLDRMLGIAGPTAPEQKRETNLTFPIARLAAVSNEPSTTNRFRPDLADSTRVSGQTGSDGTSYAIEPSPADRLRPDFAHSTPVSSQAEGDVKPYALADRASDNKNLAGLATSPPHSGATLSLSISSGAPAVLPASQTRSRLSSQPEKSVTADANTQSTVGTDEPARIVSIGELIGVAGRLRFQNESLPAPPATGMDSQLPVAQATHFQVPLTQGHSLPTPPTIAAPLGSPSWPNVFSSSIVRLATEQITEANLTVTPGDLGTINVAIALDGNRVSLSFTAENGQVREAVNASLPVLQEMLEKSGLSLGQSSVGQEAPRDTSHTHNSFGQARNPSRESDAIAVAPATPARTRSPQLDDGRVDFFA